MFEEFQMKKQLLKDYLDLLREVKDELTCDEKNGVHDRLNGVINQLEEQLESGKNRITPSEILIHLGDIVSVISNISSLASSIWDNFPD